MPRSPARKLPAAVGLRTVAAGGALLPAGCGGAQSALAPAGLDAERVADLFWWMAGGALLVWAAVVGLGLYVLHLRPKKEHPRTDALLIIGGGAAFPTVVLAALLAYGLALMPDLLALPPEGGMEIAVSGEQWWWRVRYLEPAGGGEEAGAGGAVELANELRLPLGRRVALSLESPDVIHSFWVPALGGKMDMIPGRVTRMALEPTRTGVYRGVCAEYCGASHALMAFRVVVMEEAEFEAWLAGQRRPARPPAGPLAERGAELFSAHGCGACHAVRGTSADGVIGPDLTHVGSRVSLGAGILANEPEAFRRWLAETERIKPGVHMPAFGMLPPADLDALAAYLDGLE